MPSQVADMGAHVCTLQKEDIALAKRHIYIINLHPILTMMETEQVSKRLVFSSPVTQLMAQEGFM